MTYKLLWVDDEIELLKAHILFLEKKGYEVETVTNGYDALDLIENGKSSNSKSFDLILLDENMPGLSGLETLTRVKELLPATPVVMVTKSEEEHIMEQAIGAKIADYLIKPVNPTQILLTLKKNIQQKEIVTEHTQSGYQQDFSRLGIQINDASSIEEWKDVYKKLTYWELQLSETESGMQEMLSMQRREANAGFAKFIRKNYIRWMERPEERPVMSPDIFKRTVFPLLDKGEKVFLIVIDNFRYDQWRVLLGEIAESFTVEENLYLSILPTATQYARNAIFSGLMPTGIAKMFPDLWVDEDSEEGKNLNEEPLVRTQLERYRRKNTFSYHKINHSGAVEKFVPQIPQLQKNDLNVVVINFIDMLSHARTESLMVRELASNEAAYRSITQSWLRHSAVSDLFRSLAAQDCTVVLTTDHGSIRCYNPIKVIGDRNTNTNLRYKLGKNLSYNPKEVFEIKDPVRAGLPSPNLSTTYIFATQDDFFAYPNNYNYYVQYYKDTFQHGGISMEEMLIPLITLRGKKR
ncbi:MAG: bifunctional response regulator/alkaline phosphatase family protein [Bacteroidaceae bacterium]|nr:bifunctional response regulator/alkaline phosphatase family protein [Bacteroidaceae bacterium]